MPRGLSTAAKNYSGPTAWLADITPPSAGVTYRFADQAVSFGGFSYEPYLRITGGARFSRTLAADFGEIELVNADLAVGTLLQASPEGSGFEGALCELRQLLLGLDAAPLILRGRLTEQEETDAGVRFRLVSELDPAQVQVHARNYSALCTWRFRRGLCGYLDTGFSFTEHLAEHTATSAALQSITDSTLAMTVDEHSNRYVLVTAGTGRGQLRRIRSNTATTLTVWTPWTTTPDTSSTFVVVSFTGGASKPLWTAAGSAVLEQQASSGAARSLTAAALSLTTDEHKDELVRIVSGTGAEQQRRIKTNDATSLTIADDEPDFSPAPDSTSVCVVRFRRCPKDFLACELRARTEAHNGFPTLVPLVAQAAGAPPVLPPGLGGPFGGGGDGGGAIPL